MKRPTLWITLLAAIVIGLLAGRWLGDSATTVDKPVVEKQAVPERRLPTAQPRRSPNFGKREAQSFRADAEALEAGALPGQRTVRFSSDEAMARFLASAKERGILVMDSIDALNLLRIGFLNSDQLEGLLDEEDQLGLIFPVAVPEPPQEGTVQEGAVGFGDQFLQWLGIEGDRSNWGAGLKVAVLDTGVAQHSVFSNSIQSSNLVATPSDPSLQNGHGTAVASLIASELGVAPGATILDYRVADDTGSSDTFLLAQAIIEAADAGADVINISMGSQNSSFALEAAIEYATELEAVIVASTGNNGLDSVAYPANLPNVVSVGAVDGQAEHLDFSNSGNVMFTAPGLALTSAWPGEVFSFFSGTSASAPTVSGAILATMSTQNVSANQAVQILQQNANEGGAPGNDSFYGFGSIDVGRSMRADSSGYNDLAIASHFLTTNAQGSPTVLVTVQNRGNESAYNAPLTINGPNGTQQIVINSLAPNQIRTYEVPYQTSSSGFQFQSTIGLPSGTSDGNTSNNSRISVFNP